MHSSELPNQIADQVSDAVVTAGSNAYCYDQNGNMRRRTIAGVAYTLTYDAENRLTGISGGVVTASYTYDGDGNRVKADFGAGSVTAYVGAYYEQTTSGASTTITKYYQAGDQRVALRVNGVLRWLATDHLGSTSITADGATGARTAELWYRPWGETRYSWGATPTQRRFTGQTLDGVAGGLYFYNARYYDPSLGRFTQADTIVPEPGNPQSLNRYTYVGNRPLGFVDPSGSAPQYPGDPDPNNAACSTDWCWQNRWYQAHGYGWGGSGWNLSGQDPLFYDEAIMLDVLAEAGIRLTGGTSGTDGAGRNTSWTKARIEQVALGVVKFGQKLSGGLPHLKRLLGGEITHVFLGTGTGLFCGLGSAPCALPPPWDTGNEMLLSTATECDNDLETDRGRKLVYMSVVSPAAVSCRQRLAPV